MKWFLSCDSFLFEICLLVGELDFAYSPRDTIARERAIQSHGNGGVKQSLFF